MGVIMGRPLQTMERHSVFRLTSCLKMLPCSHITYVGRFRITFDRWNIRTAGTVCVCRPFASNDVYYGLPGTKQNLNEQKCRQPRNITQHGAKSKHHYRQMRSLLSGPRRATGCRPKQKPLSQTRWRQTVVRMVKQKWSPFFSVFVGSFVRTASCFTAIFFEPK